MSIETPKTRGFRPVLVKPIEPQLDEHGEPIVDLTDNQTQMIAFLAEMAHEVTAGNLEGFVVVLIQDTGEQSEVAITDENDYSVLGRMHVAAANILDGIGWEDEDEDL